MDPEKYEGKEWDELLKALNPRDIKKTLKAAYRRVGKQVADVARASLASSGLRNGSKMKRSIRVRVYPRGGGFMVTVKPHGRQGYYKRSQDGAEKPIAMWASEGTKERYLRKGKTFFSAHPSRGRMPAYNFMDEATRKAPSIIENGIAPEIEKSAEKRLMKVGWL